MEHRYCSARDGRDSPLKSTCCWRLGRARPARDGRDSPLKYTQAAPNSLKSSELARFLFSEKQDLVWNFLGFSRLSSIEHLHLAELVIGHGHQADLPKWRNDCPNRTAVRVGCLFAGEIPRIDR